MASAALVLAAGGSAEQAGYAIAIVLQNMLGLICDPVAGLVEIPCVHRNAMGASQAMISADMALAGVKTVIPVDEVVNTMYNVGRSLPAALEKQLRVVWPKHPLDVKLWKNYLVKIKLKNSNDKIRILFFRLNT